MVRVSEARPLGRAGLVREDLAYARASDKAPADFKRKENDCRQPSAFLAGGTIRLSVDEHGTRGALSRLLTADTRAGLAAERCRPHDSGAGEQQPRRNSLAVKSGGGKYFYCRRSRVGRST